MKIVVLGKIIAGCAEKITECMHDGCKKWRLADEDDVFQIYVHDSGHKVIDDVTLPEDYEEGKYFYVDGEFVLNKDWKKYTPVEERINELEIQNEELVSDLAITDETAIELYEMQMAQNAVNIAQDDALIELYEMLGGE